MAGMPGSVGRSAGLVVATIAIFAVAFGITLMLIDNDDSARDVSLAEVPLTNDDGSQRSAVASALRDLPPPPPAGLPFRVGWDGVDGVNARIIGPSPVANGTLALSLIAARVPGRHRLGLQITEAPANRPIRAAVWVKVPAGARVAVNIRDGRSPSGSPLNSGMVMFDPAGRKVVSTGGNVQGSIEPGPRDWQKLMVDMRSADGVVVMYVALLGAGDADEFRGDGQQIIFGGIDLAAS
jgi:hypothetical protein